MTAGVRWTYFSYATPPRAACSCCFLAMDDRLKNMVQPGMSKLTALPDTRAKEKYLHVDGWGSQGPGYSQVVYARYEMPGINERALLIAVPDRDLLTAKWPISTYSNPCGFRPLWFQRWGSRTPRLLVSTEYEQLLYCTKQYEQLVYCTKQA